MDFQNFTLDSQPWIKVVCHDLFNGNLFSLLCDFDFLFDYDFKKKLAHGFSITTPYSLSMGDLVFFE